MEHRKKISEPRKRLIERPNEIASNGLKKDLKEIEDNPKNLDRYFKSNKVTRNSIEVYYKEPVSVSSNVYYEDEELMNRDFEMFEKAVEVCLKKAEITND